MQPFHLLSQPKPIPQSSLRYNVNYIITQTLKNVKLYNKFPQNLYFVAFLGNTRRCKRIKSQIILHTFFMRKLIKTSLVALYIFSSAASPLLWLGCQQNADFSAPQESLQESLQENVYVENLENIAEGNTSSATQEALQTPIDESVWDLRGVDVSHVDPEKKLIAFTFDDAPTRRLENLFAVFAAFNESNPDCKASATYFFNGMLFDNENLQLLHTAVAMGFELGNHTFSHYDLTTLPTPTLLHEIDETDKILQQADGKRYHLLRAPFGRVNDSVKSVAHTPLIDWTIDTVDWTGASTESICQQVLYHCFSGAIVLFHDGYENTIHAIKYLLPALKENGYQVVNVSQLAKMHNCTLQRGKVYIRARKQEK